MSDWTSGYVAEIGYTYGYYRELNPARQNLAFLNAGLIPPTSGIHCELGFGQGVSINIHAAAANSEWHGTDFNPSQASFAKFLASQSESNANLKDQAFEDFCERPDLPEFDSIGLHGIWSWISDANRQTIVDFIKRKLKVGGALYISYNTLPGWSVFAPIRHLLSDHASKMGSPGKSVITKVNEALIFAQELIDTQPIYSKENPKVVEKLDRLKLQDKHYLAHEYFNKDWHPMHFTTLADWLAPAKISFACSANYLDHIDAINLSAKQLNLLNEIADPHFKQGVRDFIVNQQFRRDYWVKGARKISPVEQQELIKNEKIVLITPVADITFKITGSLGEADLTKDIYMPILNVLSDYQVKSIEELASKLENTNITYPQIVQACIVLIGLGHLEPARDLKSIEKSYSACLKLNKALIQKAKTSSEIAYLASPVTGGGVAVNRFQQLFMLAQSEGELSLENWADMAWKNLSLNNQKIMKDGKPLDSEEENKEELKKQALEFSETKLPLLKALRVI